MKPRLIIRQKLTSTVQKYNFYPAKDDGTGGDKIGTAERKRRAYHARVVVYTDDTREKIAFGIREDDQADAPGRYMVSDGNGTQLGVCETVHNKYRYALRISDPSGAEKYAVNPNSRLLAFLHRYLRGVPLLGRLIELILVSAKYYYLVSDVATDRVVAEYRKPTLSKERYVFMATENDWKSIDWRLMASVGVVLDALRIKY